MVTPYEETLGNGNYRTKSANISSGNRTVTITNPQTISGGNHWDTFGIVCTMMGIDGGASGHTMSSWRHMCSGLSTWNLGGAVAIYDNAPGITQGTTSATQLVFTISSGDIPSYTTLTVEVFSHDMLNDCDIVFS